MFERRSAIEQSPLLAVYSQIVKLSFYQLDGMLDALVEKYQRGLLTDEEYVDSWNDLVEVAGWTWEEFSDEVDKHWVDNKGAVLPVFKC